jgi:hypothetical protein
MCRPGPPAQYAPLPNTVKATGEVLTVTGVVLIQPKEEVKVIVTIPADTPHTLPVSDPTVAIATEDELQLPPPPSASEVQVPMHVCVVPVIGPGKGLTVMDIVIKQPAPSE